MKNELKLENILLSNSKKNNDSKKISLNFYKLLNKNRIKSEKRELYIKKNFYLKKKNFSKENFFLRSKSKEKILLKKKIIFSINKENIKNNLRMTNLENLRKINSDRRRKLNKILTWDNFKKITNEICLEKKKYFLKKNIGKNFFKNFKNKRNFKSMDCFENLRNFNNNKIFLKSSNQNFCDFYIKKKIFVEEKKRKFFLKKKRKK